MIYNKSPKTPMTKAVYRTLFLIGCLIVPFVLSAQQTGLPPGGGEEDLTPEERELEKMLGYMEANIPGPEIERLLMLNGTWSTEITFRSGPEAEVATSEGVAEISVLLGGRYVQLRQEGELREFPFESLQLMGFDRNRSRYFAHLFDTMGRSGVVLTGVYEMENSRIVLMGRGFDKVLNTELTYEYVLQLVAPHEFRTELYLQSPRMRSAYLSKRTVFRRE